MKRAAFLMAVTFALLPAVGIVQASPDPEKTEVIIVPAGDKFLRWDGQVGRTYFIQASDPNAPLKEWLWMPVIESGTGVEISHEILTTADKAFFRLWFTDDQPPGGIALDDWDADGDGLSNKAEIELYQTNPLDLDTDDDGLLDGPDVSGGTDPNDPDSDDDGITDGGEVDEGTDPTDAGEAPLAEWFVLTGDLGEDDLKKRNRTLTIPAGERRLILVGIASEEYVQGWTDPATAPDYNDRLTWSIKPSAGSTSSGTIDVNARHVNWQAAEAEGSTLHGFDPVHFEHDSVLQAPESSSLSIEIELSATNVGDGLLPSTVIVAVMPLEIQVRKPQLGKWVSTDELKVAKWEEAWDGVGAFRQDFIDAYVGEELDRFRILVATDELPEPFDQFFVETAGDSDDHNDTPTKLVLQLEPGAPNLGIASDGYVSKPMILVSDAVDNGFKNADQQDDQTHIAALGSEVNFRLSAADGDVGATLPVLARASVEVSSLIVTPNGGVDDDLLALALDDIALAREIYAQIGLEVFATVQFVPIPPGVDLDDGLLLDTTTTLGTLSSDALNLLNALGTPGDQSDVRVIYVSAEMLTGKLEQGRREAWHSRSAGIMRQISSGRFSFLSLGMERRCGPTN